MALYLLDTDHLTFYQHGHPQVTARINAAGEGEITASVISYEEQLRGRLAVIRKAKTREQMAYGYFRLREMQEFFCALRLLDFDEKAAAIHPLLRQLHRHAGKMDLRIAATALAHNATLVTRNTQDFIDIENLRLENWA